MSEEDILLRKRDDVQWILSTEQGRRFIWDLISHCRVYHALEGDPNSMLVQEGTRRVGLHILGITTDASEDRVFQMMLESKNRVLEEIEKNDNANNSDRARGPDAEYDYHTSGDASSGSDLPAYDSGASFDSFF